MIPLRQVDAEDKAIAYFSMEIGLEAGMPTYGGGLGVLAGDPISRVGPQGRSEG
ncbi:MAG TPA: hypothetical protein VNL14_12060 [Candidatus Acidoferrales bacterium]|nr:hypothetical protein [Candidatus Acidoferrales bacterium]